MAPIQGLAGRVRALIFDMDGTLIDSMPWHRQSWVEFAERRGLAIDAGDLMRRTTGRNGAECMRELFGADLADDDAWRLIGEKEAIYRELFGPRFQEVRGARRLAAEAAAAGLQIGVGTAGDRHNIAFGFGHLDWAPLPHAVVGGDEGLPGKPDPAIFLEVARRLGVDPGHCLVFEDAPLGIEAARRAGMAAIAVCTGHTADELAGAHVRAAIPHYTDAFRSGFLATLTEETSHAP
jgi:beta-phosphoglucomutase-like phosphatase (HAD superfamily)